MECAQAVQAAVAACDASQQAHICQIACNQLDQSCRQLPHASTPKSASHPSSSLRAGTHSPQGKLQQHVDTSDSTGKFDSTAAQSNAMVSAGGNSMLHSLQSEQQAMQLLAQSAAVSAAAVAALHPAALLPDVGMPLLERLVKLGMALPDGGSQQACMVAAAAVVNKWPPGGCNTACCASLCYSVASCVCTSICTITQISVSGVVCQYSMCTIVPIDWTQVLSVMPVMSVCHCAVGCGRLQNKQHVL